MSAKKKGPPIWGTLTAAFTLIAVAVAAIPFSNYFTGKRKLEGVVAELKAEGISTDYEEVLPPAPQLDESTFANHALIQTCFLPSEVTDDVPLDEPGPYGDFSVEQVAFLQLLEVSEAYKAGRFIGLEDQILFDLDPVVQDLGLEVGAEGALEAVVAWMAEFDEIMAELAQAAKLPAGVGPRVRYVIENPLATSCPHYSRFVRLTRVVVFRSLIALEQGDSQKAFEELTVVFRMMELLEQEPTLMPFMVRITMLRMLLKPVWQGLAARTWKAPELAALQDELTLTGLHLDVADALWSDALAMKGALANPHMVREEPAFRFPGVASHNAANLLTTYHYHVLERIRGEDWEGLVLEMFPSSVLEKKRNANWIVVGIHEPTTRVGTWKAVYCEALRNCALAAIDLELYYLKEGAYPATLDVLPGEYVDVLAHGPLSYIAEGEERYRVYSIGRNLVDDGGEPGFDYKGRMEDGVGDVVWTYPPAEE